LRPDPWKYLWPVWYTPRKVCKEGSCLPYQQEIEKKQTPKGNTFSINCSYLLLANPGKLARMMNPVLLKNIHFATQQCRLGGMSCGYLWVGISIS